METVLINTGEFTVRVPEGWLPIEVMDMRAENLKETTPHQLQICKGAQTALDLLSNPYIHIVHYPPATDIIKPPSFIYKEVKQVADIQYGKRIWNGFTAVQRNKPLALLWSGEKGEDQFQVAFWLKTDTGEIKLDDNDVKLILESIEVSA